jgi:AraC-like DNA-binding protein
LYSAKELLNPADMKSSHALPGFDPDDTDRPATALKLQMSEHADEIPFHTHRKGQLILALHGAVTCQVAGALWIVPPQCGVWIPGQMPHSNRATANAQLCYLFAEPGVAALPRECCTLSVSPMIREMILRLAEEPLHYARDGHAERLGRVLLEELSLMPKEMLSLPVSDHPKVRKMAQALSRHPDDRSTLAQWAKRLAIGERTLARLLLQETGLTFGRWRQQLHLLVAIRELAAGSSVQRVAEHLGYESVAAFITMFKKSLGQTPTRYFASLAKSQFLLPHEADASLIR